MFSFKNALKLKKNLKSVLSQLEGQCSYYKNSQYYVTGAEFNMLKEIKEKVVDINKTIENLEREMQKNRRI